MAEPRQALPALILGRLGQSAITLGIVLVFVFLIFQGLGDPVRMELGIFASPEAIEARRSELGLSGSLTEQLGHFFTQARNLHFGDSIIVRKPSHKVLLDHLWPTLAYAGVGYFFATTLAVLAAMYSALSPESKWSRFFSTCSIISIATPSLVLVLLAHHLLTHVVAIFPVLGWPLLGDTTSLIVHLILPCSLWITFQFGADYSVYRGITTVTAQSPCYDGLRARGLSETSVARHFVHHVSVPIIARAAHRLPYLFVGSVLLETVFNIPGLGELTSRAILSHDLPLIATLTMWLATATICIQTIADIVGYVSTHTRPGEVE